MACDNCISTVPMNFMGHSIWDDVCFKRKFRWLMFINGVSQEGVNALPPLKTSRPNVSFKEIEVQHLNETIYYPGRPEWKPIQLTLYDVQRNFQNPVFSWLKRVYDPSGCGTYRPSQEASGSGCLKVANVALVLYDGCGEIMEVWSLDAAWPQSVEFGELDMGSSEVVTCDVTLRYDRAYMTYPISDSPLDYSCINSVSCVEISSSPIVSVVPCPLPTPTPTPSVAFIPFDIDYEAVAPMPFLEIPTVFRQRRV